MAHASCPNGHGMWDGDGKPIVWAFRVGFIRDLYEWSTDWTDYFDDGHEWWETSCFSIYDSSKDRYVLILVSATD